jgi:hypothetical protein
MPEISYSELQSRLQKLRNMDLSTTPYREIIDAINSKIVLPVLITEVRVGNYIERIRINKEGEIFTSKKELSYRTDLENIKTFGRANSPGSSMFYGAVISSPIQLPRIVALAETDELLRSQEKGTVDKDLIMTVSKWHITKNMRLAEMVFKKDRIPTTPEIEKAYNFHLKAFRENMAEEEVQKLISILEFYSEEFARSTICSDTDYKISAAYAESAFKNGRVQGIIYPSVRTDYEDSNVALLPATVEHHLQFEEALIIHVQIKGKKVFLDNLYRTGVVAADATDFGWYKMESASQEVKNQFFSA